MLTLLQWGVITARWLVRGILAACCNRWTLWKSRHGIPAPHKPLPPTTTISNITPSPAQTHITAALIHSLALLICVLLSRGMSAHLPTKLQNTPFLARFWGTIKIIITLYSRRSNLRPPRHFDYGWYTWRQIRAFFHFIRQKCTLKVISNLMWEQF